MKKISQAVMLTALAFGFSTQANAAINCSGTISSVHTQDDGIVVIYGSWRNSYTQICSVKTVWKGIDPQTCWAWFANASTAVSNSQLVVVRYDDPAATDCSTLPFYAASLPPGYFMLK